MADPLKVDRLSIISSSTVLPIEGTKSQMWFYPNLTFTVAIRCTATRLCRNRCHLAIPLSLSISQDSQELMLCLSFLLLALLLAKSYCGENAQVCLASIRYGRAQGFHYNYCISQLSEMRCWWNPFSHHDFTQLEIMIPINPVTCTYRPNGLVLSRSPSNRVRVRQDRNQTDCIVRQKGYWFYRLLCTSDVIQ